MVLEAPLVFSAQLVRENGGGRRATPPFEVRIPRTCPYMHLDCLGQSKQAAERVMSVLIRDPVAVYLLEYLEVA